MNKKEALKKDVKITEFSPFAQFCLNSRGYEYQTAYGCKLDKWEVFCKGYNNAENIITGKTKIVTLVKEEELT